MKPIDILSCLSPFGRINRLTYLGFVIATYVLAMVASVLLMPFMRSLPLGGMLAARFLLGPAIFLYPGTCMAIKRLHDMGWSGFFILAPLVFPALGVAFLFFAVLTEPANGPDGDMRAIAFGGPLMVMLVTVVGFGLFKLLLLVIPGQSRDNRFGPIPAGLSGREAATLS